MTNELVAQETLPYAGTNIPIQLFQVSDETLDLSWSADRPMARDDSTRLQPQNNLQGSNLTLEVCILQVRMITHPENISRKQNPVSRHEYDRVAISVGPRLGMDDRSLQQIIQLRPDFARKRDIRIGDLYASKHPRELWVSLTISVKQFLRFGFHAATAILIRDYHRFGIGEDAVSEDMVRMVVSVQNEYSARLRIDPRKDRGCDAVMKPCVNNETRPSAYYEALVGAVRVENILSAAEDSPRVHSNLGDLARDLTHTPDSWSR